MDSKRKTPDEKIPWKMIIKQEDNGKGGGIKRTEGNGQGGETESGSRDEGEASPKSHHFETNMIFGSRVTFCIAYGI